MSIQFFGRGSRRAGLTIDLPKDYNTKLRWLPRIGDVFPDFSAESSHGPLRFRDWAAGSWVYLFSHPAAFTPVCTTELADVAAREEDFQDRGVKPLNLSRDTVAEQLGWVEDIAEIFDVRPTFPLVSDPHGTLASVCGMIHPKEDAAMCIRKAFILDPARRIRMIFEYPMRVGRSVEETRA